MDSVNVVKVDCTANRGLCKSNGVRGYPTLKYFKNGDVTGSEKYKGGRSFDALKKFVDERAA